MSAPRLGAQWSSLPWMVREMGGDAPAVRLLRRWWARLGTASLGSGAITVAVCTLGVKGVAALKELAIAFQFGRGDEVDAFVMAFLLPAFAVNVIGASLGVVVVPAYLETEYQQGREAAKRLLENWFTITVVVLVAAVPLVAGVAFIMLPVLAPSFDPPKLHLTRSLLLVLAPCLAASGIGSFFGAQLNARGRFLAVAIAPAVTPLVTITLVATASHRMGIMAVAVATALGAMGEAIVQWAALKRAGGSVRLAWAGFDPVTKHTLSQCAHVAFGALVGSAQYVIDNSFAAHLGKGAAAALSYANKLPALVLGLAAGAWIAAFPHYSERVAAQDWRGLRVSLKRHALAYAGLALPMTLALVLASRPLSRLLFERGAFTATDTEVVARVQSFYLLQIPFYILYMLLSRLLTAMKANHVVARGAVLYLVADILFNILFIRLWGVAGIALSTSCVVVVSLTYVALAVRRLLAEQETRSR